MARQNIINTRTTTKDLFTRETAQTQASGILLNNTNSTYLCYTTQIRRTGSPTTAFHLSPHSSIILDKTPYKSDNSTKLLTIHKQ